MLSEHVEETVREREKIIARYMDEIKAIAPEKIRVRGIGYVWGVDLYHCDPEGKTSKAVLDECFRHRLIVERVGRGNSVIKVMPELLIDEDTLCRGLEILKDAVRTVVG